MNIQMLSMMARYKSYRMNATVQRREILRSIQQLPRQYVQVCSKEEEVWVGAEQQGPSNRMRVMAHMLFAMVSAADVLFAWVLTRRR